MRPSIFFPLAPVVLLGACLGGRARLDEWTPVPRAQIDSAYVIRGSPLHLAMKSDRDASPPDRPHNGGLAGTLGVGSGTGTIVCRACAHAGSMRGTSFTIQLAQRVSPQLRAGWSVDAWSHSGDHWERGIWDLSAVLFYSPSTDQRFFVGGGPSYSMMFASVTDSTALQRHGWGVMAEMGYELPVRTAASLTPFVQYSRAWVGDIYYPKGSGIPWARGWKHQVLSVGLGVTLHNRKRE